MDEPQPNKFDSTINKIDRLYSQKEWEEEKAARVPKDTYAHTVTGQQLAEVIDEMVEERERLPQLDSTEPADLGASANDSADDIIDIAPTDASDDVQQVFLIDTNTPLPVSRSDGADDDVAVDDEDGITRMMQDFEYRIRDLVDSSALQHAADVEGKYQEKMKRLRRAAAVEVQKRQALERRKQARAYKNKELKLRNYYKKLMGLANKITEQKAQLQTARKQFEEKLTAANAVYKQVEDMRKTLSEHIGELPQRSDNQRKSA